MKLSNYLNFDGRCEAAFTFYQSCLGGEIMAMMRWHEMPGQEKVSASQRDKIIHACLMVDGYMLMGSDLPPDQPYQGVKGAEVVIDVDTPEEAERLFERLSEGGNVTMPIGETFWARRFAMFADRFGVPWMINCSKEEVAT